jgi:hypothetical protein
VAAAAATHSPASRAVRRHSYGNAANPFGEYPAPPATPRSVSRDVVSPVPALAVSDLHVGGVLCIMRYHLCTVRGCSVVGSRTPRCPSRARIGPV